MIAKPISVQEVREYECYLTSMLIVKESTPALSAASSTESFGIIRSWLDKCLNEHQDCSSGNEDRPTRLLDVGPPDGSLEPRIVCGKECQAQKAGYLALSYCWGSRKECPWVLTTGNIESFMTRIHLHSLPRSFQDVIKLARGLYERYIWIDSLCILQDSPDDWEKEASSMARIYANSLCTIISPSPDPLKALLIERDLSQVSPAALQLFSRNQ